MPTPFVAGIAGSSGSGKTFFLRSLLSHFSAEQITLISQDDYYIPANTKTREENMLYNFDLPTAIDRAAFYRDIKDLLNGKTVYKEEYTFNNPQIKPQTLEIKPAPILVIEGLFIYHYDEINELINYKVFINAEASVALRRRIERDFVERGYNEDEVRYKWDNHVIPAFKKYLLPFQTACDLVIHNNSNDLKIIEDASLSLSRELKNRLAELRPRLKPK